MMVDGGGEAAKVSPRAHRYSDMQMTIPRQPFSSAPEDTAAERIPGVLTGEALQHILEVEFARSRRYLSAFALLRIRLHAERIQIPEAPSRRRLAGVIRAATRWADTVGAQPDGTLLVILRETDASGAAAVVAKIQSRLDQELPGSSQPAVGIETAVWRRGDDMTSLSARFA